MPRRTRIFVAFLAALWGAPAEAQESFGASIGDNLAAGREATDFLSRLRIRSAYWKLKDVAELVPTRVSATYAPRADLALRLQVPVPYVDPDRKGSSTEFGLGDISTRVLWRLWNRPRCAGFAGVEHFFPTASDSTLGTEKYVVSPIAALFFPVTSRFSLIPVYQQLISYAGKGDRADLNIVRFRPIVVATLPGRWWLLLDPSFFWDLEDDLETDDTMALGLEVGKRLSQHFSLSGKPSIQVYGSEDFSWAFEASLTFNFK